MASRSEFPAASVPRRHRVVVGAMACLLALTACSSGSDDVAGPVTAASAAPSSAVPSPSPAAVPSAAGTFRAGRILAVTVRSGAVTGTTGRVAVQLGEQLVISVTSDVAEQVHVHGYDERADVAAGSTVEIPFTASIPGSFEVELEGSGRTLFQLRVS